MTAADLRHVSGSELDDLVVSDDPPEPQPRPDPPRRRPQTLGGLVYLVMAAVTFVGLAIAVLGSWRTGLAWMGAALCLGAVARLVLADEHAGMLKVRRKSLDVAMLLAFGGGLIALALAVPGRPA